jgi:hypothetical protein
VHIDNGKPVAEVIPALAAYQIIAGAQANYTFYTTQGQNLARGRSPTSRA